MDWLFVCQEIQLLHSTCIASELWKLQRIRFFGE